jgi:hypothetical protein
MRVSSLAFDQLVEQDLILLSGIHDFLVFTITLMSSDLTLGAS